MLVLCLEFCKFISVTLLHQFINGFLFSISFQGAVEHYRVSMYQNDQLSLDGGESLFDNLIELIEVSRNCYAMHCCLTLPVSLFWFQHYQREAGGLCCRLKNAIIRP